MEREGDSVRNTYIEKLRELMRSENIDAVLVCPSDELRFLTGFSPMMCERFQGLFIEARGGMFYIANKLYADEIRDAYGAGVPVHEWTDNEGMTEVVPGQLKKLGFSDKTVGVNSSAQAFNILDLAEATGIRFVNARPLLEEMRIRKTSSELQALREAAAIVDRTFVEVLPKIRTGMTEANVRDLLFDSMTAQGGTEPWAVVASGPNSGFGHYFRYDRHLRPGDALMLDFGCTYKEMKSDITRTVFAEKADEEQRKVYDLVNRANYAAQDAVFEGAFIPDIDKAARAVLTQGGYEHTMTTRVGHGIGYMGHEGPDIKQSNPRKLERGMAFSIEPGIYLPGRFGVRIENIVVINDQGNTEVLNKAPRDLFLVGAGSPLKQESAHFT
jgi:Xaa-Pro dipeptidase